MNWIAAKSLARKGLHVRRESWPAGAWLIYQRGIAWFWTGMVWRVVEAGDFGSAEWLAQDWTQIPAALEDCPPPPPDDGGGADDDDDSDGGDSGEGSDGGQTGGDGESGGGGPSPIDPDEPPREVPVGGGGGGGGGGGPSGPTPPGPPVRPGCLPPSLTCTSLIYCPDSGNPTNKRISIAASLVGGNGTWSVKARIGARLINMGLVTAPGSPATLDTTINCVDSSSQTVFLTAVGFGDCSPIVISSSTAAVCECDPDCATDYQSFSETHGDDECPNIGEPCQSSPTPSCAGAMITTMLTSRPFSNACLDGKTPQADVTAFFDDFGFIGSLSCDNTGGGCASCGVSGTVTPEVLDQGNGTFLLRVQAGATNAHWGGPYSLNCDATFYFV